MGAILIVTAGFVCVLYLPNPNGAAYQPTAVYPGTGHDPQALKPGKIDPVPTFELAALGL